MARSISVLLGCTMAWACAPSHRMVHDGNVYFEHCYGAEFNAAVTPMEREACWNAWLADYTRHQPAHRIDYAMRRVEAIQAGDQTLKLPGISTGPSSPPTDPSVSSHMRLRSAHVGAEVATTMHAEDAGVSAVPHGCHTVCKEYQQHCQANCPPDSPDCRLLCAREEAICSQGCY
ncbi:MAG: hypothetical protein QM778_01005 [Myxococcales bacterium]